MANQAHWVVCVKCGRKFDESEEIAYYDENDKKMAAALMDPDDEDDQKTLQRIYQEPIDFNLALRETLGKYIEVSLMKEEENNG